MQSEAEAIFEHSDFCYTASNVTLSISPTSRTTRISSPLLSGGALGIGAALVSLLHSAGAHVFFSHVLTEPAEALLHDLTPSSSTGQKLHFIHTDVADYASNIHLFRTAYEVCGRTDHAVSAAGIGEKGNIFDPELTLEMVQEPPPLSVVDVNLIGTIYFVRIASVYLRQPVQDDGASNTTRIIPLTVTNKSLTLVSSVAGFIESPGLFVYQATKHGVLGLMRSLRE